jgi:hypothetical protein
MNLQKTYELRTAEREIGEQLGDIRPLRAAG